jgi:hypothetical protein
LPEIGFFEPICPEKTFANDKMGDLYAIGGTFLRVFVPAIPFSAGSKSLTTTNGLLKLSAPIGSNGRPMVSKRHLNRDRSAWHRFSPRFQNLKNSIPKAQFLPADRRFDRFFG